MSSIHNPFSTKRPPRMREALKALGIDTGEEQEQKEPAGRKPLHLDLTAEETARLKEIEESAETWNRKRLIKWARTFDKDEQWIDKTFDIQPDKIVCKEEALYLDNTQVSEIPPNLQVKVLWLHGTKVTKIPEGTAIQQVHVDSSQTELIASAKSRGIEVDELQVL